ncbi:hypothetical protein J2W30_004480 [Variovorax boronicumulans]|nr:hypothetical protein [Variovorax boronicumulans]
MRWSRRSRACMQKRLQAFLCLLQVADFALPKLEHSPAEAYKGGTVPLVPGPVRFDLWGPVRRIRLRPGRDLAQMTMPKAAVYKYCLLVLGQHDIGPAWEVLAMDPEPKSQPVKHGSDDEFGLGVLAADPAHEEGPSLWCEGVHAVSILGLSSSRRGKTLSACVLLATPASRASSTAVSTAGRRDARRTRESPPPPRRSQAA